MGKLWIWLLIAARFQDSNCQENELPSCPTPCDCKWKSGKPTINCRDKNLTYVPYYQPVDDEKLYKVLVMDNNDILLTADPQFSAVGYDEVQTQILTLKSNPKKSGNLTHSLNNQLETAVRPLKALNTPYVQEEESGEEVDQITPDVEQWLLADMEVRFGRI